MASTTFGDIEILSVTGPALLKRFIRLPDRIMAPDPNYIPPLHSERQAALTPKGNPFFGHADAAFWLARKNGVDVGRISAQIDHLTKPEPEAPIGNFGMLSAIDDKAVFAALLATAEAWLAERGIKRVQGPFSLSINEESGLLIDGFDTPPMLMMPHDASYVAAHIDAAGYGKIRDLYAYLCDTTAALPPRSAAMVARGLPSNVTLRPMQFKTLKQDIASLVSIFNDAWATHWGFVPITEPEVDHMAKAMRPLLHEKLIWFADVDGEPAAFGLCLPDLNAAIRDLSGSLLPLGWAKLLWRLKVSGVPTARVPLMGVRKRYGEGMLGRLLALHVVESLRREALAKGIKAVEMSWILEDNLPMRHLAEAVGGRQYKTYRVYEKTLTA
ncbi:dATP pyrophosphohydrolase [Acidisoma cellulosilytica]|uniref:dATP pyrophosphohydrolase n=1 Tax=Acidisoma cellulosilyticum TaxID=2802395 RepID=A0A963Z613_9PROT|nr:dATP pyrophosphohydrolase [Acidisoma cellulosilyticum]MCB8882458.1 dATP pyrophosphohydrolase [Acidisoma cellulosilyticum]